MRDDFSAACMPGGSVYTSCPDISNGAAAGNRKERSINAVM